MLVPLLFGSLFVAAPAPAFQDTKHDDVRALLEQGETDAAIRQAKEILERDPGDAVATLLLGQALDWLGDASCEAMLARAVERAGDDAAIVQEAAAVLANRAAALFQNDGHASSRVLSARDGADAAYRRWAELQPGNPLPLHWMAWTRSNTGAADDAIAMEFAAIAIDPLVDAPHDLLWSFLGGALQYDALAAYYAALGAGLDDPARRARCIDFEGRVRCAKGDALRATAAEALRRGDRTQQVTALADARLAYLAALPCFERAAGLDDGARRRLPAFRAFYRIHVVETFAETGDPAAAALAAEPAKEALAEVLRLPDANPEQTRADVTRLAAALYRAVTVSGADEARVLAADQEHERFFEWARAEATDAAAIDPMFFAIEPAVQRAELAGERRDLDAVERHVAAARARFESAWAAGSEPPPAVVDAVDRLGFAIFVASGGEGGARRGMQLAKELWRYATERAPARAEWWNNYGFFARESAAYDESYAAYRRAVDLEPDNVRYVNDTGLIQLYHLQTDLSEAERLFRRAIELGEQQYRAAADDPVREPDLRSAWGDALLNLGLLCMEQERYDEARTAYEALADLDPGRVDLLSQRLELSARTGDLDAARALVEEALAGPPDDGQPLNRVAVLRAVARDLAAERPDGDALKDLLLRLADAAPEADGGGAN